MNKKLFIFFLTLCMSPLLSHAEVASTTFTFNEVASHASTTDCWIIVSDKVYSVASYISLHPGGKNAIANFCGKDATKAFVTKGGKGKHSTFAHSTLGNFLVGNLSVSTSTQNSTIISTSTNYTNSTSTSERLFVTCRQSIIETRDSKIIEARTLYSNAINTAMLKRKEGEKLAIAITDISTKKIAFKKVLNEYKTATKEAQNTLTLARKKILENAEQQSKDCKIEKEDRSKKINKEKDDFKNNKKDMKKNEDTSRFFKKESKKDD